MSGVPADLKADLEALLKRAVEYGREQERADMAAKLGFAEKREPQMSGNGAGGIHSGSRRPTSLVRRVFADNARDKPITVSKVVDLALKAAPSLTEQQVRTAIKVLYDGGDIERVETGVYRATAKMEAGA